MPDKEIDSRLSSLTEWAKNSRLKAEQLALDSVRLLACAADQLKRFKNQGFFKRCQKRFGGDASSNTLTDMQKTAFSYMRMLHDEQVLQPHSLLAIKNNLNALAVNGPMRDMAGQLAQLAMTRIDSLESRVDQLEISSNLQGWLLGLSERDYDEKYPAEPMRLLRIINDFYRIKSDNWNYNDLMFLRKAIRTVGLDPKQKLSLNAFIGALVDEIQADKASLDVYDAAITQFAPPGIANYSKFAVENISSPVFIALHGLNNHYMDRLEMVEELREEMNISASEALKRLLTRSIKNLNVNMDYQFTLAEMAIEILGSMRLAEKLGLAADEEAQIIDVSLSETAPVNYPIITSGPKKSANINVNALRRGEWREAGFMLHFDKPLPTNASLAMDNGFVFADNEGIWFSADLQTKTRIGDMQNAAALYILNDKLCCLTPEALYAWTRADLVENSSNFQPYALAFREKSKFFRLLLRGRPRMGARAV